MGFLVDDTKYVEAIKKLKIGDRVNIWENYLSQCFVLIMSKDQNKCGNCGSNVFQGYFDDVKESRVKQIPKIK